MIYAHLSIFIKATMGIVFFISAFTKLRDFQQFVKTVQDFRLLPTQLVLPSAALFLMAEVVVVGLLYFYPLVALLLALFLLITFSLALASVLLRNIKTNCNCFGTSSQIISPLDLIRNGGLIFCTLCGIWIGSQPNIGQLPSPLYTCILGFGALAFVLIWMQIGEIIRLFQIQSI